MPEEPTTPDPLETLRGGVEAFNRRDFDTFLAVWAQDAVWELSQIRMGVFEMSPPTSRAAREGQRLEREPDRLRGLRHQLNEVGLLRSHRLADGPSCLGGPALAVGPPGLFA
jgi:ketosteroid isomerase-like protein